MDWLDEAIQLLATPQRLREKTVTAFCEEHDLPPANFYYHLSKPENKKRILEITLNKAKDAAPEVLDALIEKAKAGDVRAADIYIESILQLAKQLDIKSDGKAIVFVPTEIAAKNSLNTDNPEEIKQ